MQWFCQRCWTRYTGKAWKRILLLVQSVYSFGTTYSDNYARIYLDIDIYKTNSDWTAHASRDDDSYFLGINQSCTQRYYNRRFDRARLIDTEKVTVNISRRARGQVAIGLVYCFLTDCDCTKPLNVVWLSVPFFFIYIHIYSYLRNACDHISEG